MRVGTRRPIRNLHRLTGHAEVVFVVYDHKIVSMPTSEDLLEPRPTGDASGQRVGTTNRSAIYTFGEIRTKRICLAHPTGRVEEAGRGRSHGDHLAPAFCLEEHQRCLSKNYGLRLEGHGVDAPSRPPRLSASQRRLQHKQGVAADSAIRRRRQPHDCFQRVKIPREFSFWPCKIDP